MAYETGTFTNSELFYDNLIAKLKSTAFMGVGNEWVNALSYRDPTNHFDPNNFRKHDILYAPFGGENIHIGFSYQCPIPHAAGQTGFITFAGYPQFTAIAGSSWNVVGDWATATVYSVGDVAKNASEWAVCVQPHTSGTTPNFSGINDGFWLQCVPSDLSTLQPLAHLPDASAVMWDGGSGDIPYWLSANERRVIFVTKSDSRYHLSYIGGVRRYGHPDFHPFPVMIAGNSNNIVSPSWSNTGNVNWPLSTQSAHVCMPNITQWSPSVETIETSVRGSATSTVVSPGIGAGYNHASGEVPIAELTAFVDDFSESVMFGVDGLYWVANKPGIVSEDIIEIGGDDYIVFENVYRSTSGGFVAIKLE